MSKEGSSGCGAVRGRMPMLGKQGAWVPLVHIMMEEATAALAYELLASCLWSEAGQPEQAYV